MKKYIALTLLLAAYNCFADYTVSQEELVKKVVESIIIQPESGIENQSSYKNSLNINEALKGKIPSTISFKNEHSYEYLSSKPIHISSNNKELNQLKIIKKAQDIVLLAKQELLTPEMTEQTKISLQKNAYDISSGIKRSMLNRMSDIVSETIINDELDLALNDMLFQIDNQGTYWMQIPVEQSVINEIVSVFDERLQQSKQVAVEKIAEAQKKQDDGSVDFTSQRYSTYVDMVSAGIVSECINFAKKGLFKATTNTSLSTLNPDTIVPSYSKVISRIDEIETAILTEKAKQNYIDNKTSAEVKTLLLEADDKMDEIVTDFDLNPEHYGLSGSGSDEKELAPADHGNIEYSRSETKAEENNSKNQQLVYYILAIVTTIIIVLFFVRLQRK